MRDVVSGNRDRDVRASNWFSRPALQKIVSTNLAAVEVSNGNQRVMAHVSQIALRLGT